MNPHSHIYQKGKEPIPRGYRVYDSTYVTLLKMAKWWRWRTDLWLSHIKDWDG
jgi:hypothetical protein